MDVTAKEPVCQAKSEQEPLSRGGRRDPGHCWPGLGALGSGIHPKAWQPVMPPAPPTESPAHGVLPWSSWWAEAEGSPAWHAARLHQPAFHGLQAAPSRSARGKRAPGTRSFPERQKLPVGSPTPPHPTPGAAPGRQWGSQVRPALRGSQRQRQRAPVWETLDAISEVIHQMSSVQETITQMGKQTQREIPASGRFQVFRQALGWSGLGGWGVGGGRRALGASF